jgi:hypothetical protein
MDTILKRSVQAIGIVAFGYVAVRIVKTIGAILVLATAGLIALWMITHTLIWVVDADNKTEITKVQYQSIDKQADREQELKLQRMGVNTKIDIRLGVDKAINEAAVKRLLELGKRQKG